MIAIQIEMSSKDYGIVDVDSFVTVKITRNRDEDVDCHVIVHDVYFFFKRFYRHRHSIVTFGKASAIPSEAQGCGGTGNTSGIQAVNPDDQILTQNSAYVEDVCEANGCFGDTLTVGYFNRAKDKAADLAIGVPGEDIFCGMTAILRTDAGAVNVIYGSPTGLSAVYQHQFWTQDSAYVDDTSESYDFFGGQRY